MGQILIGTTSTGLVAYTISKIKPAGYKIVWGMLLSTLILPNAITIVPVYMTWLDFPVLHLNLLNTYWPFWIPAFGAGVVTTAIYKAFFDNVPSSILEASKIDGCSEVGIFFRIVLPICKPIIVTTVITQFNASWSDFFGPFLYLTDKEKWTVMLYAFKLNGLPIDEMLLVLTFSMLPPMIVFFFFQKHIMNGFTMSGVKE